MFKFEGIYKVSRGGVMRNLLQDISYGWRMLSNNRGFAITAILSLALGIGANTTIFSVINATLLNRLPYKDPSRIMVLWNVPLNRTEKGATATSTQSLPDPH